MTANPLLAGLLAARLASPMEVRTHRDAAGTVAIIRTDDRSMTVRLTDNQTPAVSLQMTVAELRDQASTILARADFIERAAHVLLGRDKRA